MVKVARIFLGTFIRFLAYHNGVHTNCFIFVNFDQMTDREKIKQIESEIQRIAREVEYNSPEYKQCLHLLSFIDKLEGKEIQRLRDDCSSCIHNLTGLFPCTLYHKSEVRDYINMRGVYSDPKRCCSEWIDEY